MALTTVEHLNLFINASQELIKLGDSTQHHELKQQVITNMPYVKQLALAGNSRACYWYAKAQIEDSEEHRFWLNQSFQEGKGNANAGVELAQSLIKEPSNLSRVAKIIIKLSKSKEHFIRDQVAEFKSQHPELNAVLSSKDSVSYKAGLQRTFFNQKDKQQQSVTRPESTPALS